jgi:hypothetical protein
MSEYTEPKLEELVNYTDHDGRSYPARVQGFQLGPRGYYLDLQVLGDVPRFEGAVPPDPDNKPHTWKFPGKSLLNHPRPNPMR